MSLDQLNLGATGRPSARRPAGPIASFGARLAGSGTLQRLLARRSSVLICSLVALIVVLVIIGPFIAPDSPTLQNLAISNDPAWLFGGSFSHLLGTDQYGRDILSRILVGLRPSILIGLGAASLGAVIGLIAGVFAGYHERTAGAVILRLAELQLSLPFYVIALAIIATVGGGLLPLFLLLAGWGWSTYARTIANAVSELNRQDFVAASRLAGCSTTRIMLRHIVPNVLAPVVVIWSGTIGYVILAESALDFIGLGLHSPSFSLGTMLADAQTDLSVSWAGIVFPGVTLALAVIVFNLFGDALRDALQPNRG